MSAVVWEDGIASELNDFSYRQWLIANRFLVPLEERLGKRPTLWLDDATHAAARRHIEEGLNGANEMSIPLDQVEEYVLDAWAKRDKAAARALRRKTMQTNGKSRCWS